MQLCTESILKSHRIAQDAITKKAMHQKILVNYKQNNKSPVAFEILLLTLLLRDSLGGDPHHLIPHFINNYSLYTNLLWLGI